MTDEDKYWPVPTAEVVKFNVTKSKTISAFAFNNAGTRFAAGGHDYEVRIWDFGALDPQQPKPICNTQPCGQTIIKSLDYSSDDQLILVVSGSCQAAIVAKDGLLAKQYQCPKGDQYISDMANTKGHVQMLNDGQWHPSDVSTFITCSNDCTVRIWDLNKLSQQKTIIKMRSPASGLKAVPNVCRYNRDGSSIVAACNDGSVLMWDTRRKFISTSACIRGAHLKGSEITGLQFSGSNGKICTRSDDETCKVWDVRQLKQPLATRSALPTLYSTTDCSFSPDDKLVITGSSATKQLAIGQLHFLDANDLSSKSSLDVSGASVIRSKWHPKINHVGYTSSNGGVCIAYDKSRSSGGLQSKKAIAGGNKRRRYIDQQESSQISNSIKRIITPHALPLFRDDQTSTSFSKIRQDPKLSYKPEVPVVGASQGGRVIPAGSTLSSYIAKNIARPVDDGGLDIRQRILRHAEESEKSKTKFI